MSFFVRPSKYRHVYGSKSKVQYENAKVSGSAWDTDLVTAGGKYIAVNWQVSGGGAFAVLPSFSPVHLPSPSGFPTKLPDLMPLARGHTGPVLDTAWSPFDDNLVVSAGEDGKIFIWNVDDGLFEGWGEEGWEPEDLTPSAKLNAGGRKAGHVVFNPAAAGLLASASGDHIIRIWDIVGGQESPALQLTGHKDGIQSIAWNAVGTTIATTCRDRKLRLFDPRSGSEPVRVTDGHGGIKGSRVVWLGDRDRIATTGFSRMSDRQLSLWETGGLKNLDTESLDSSAGIIIPYFVEGNDLLFLAGKGDGNIRYYEFADDQFYPLSEYKTSDPQRGLGFVPRRALDVSQNEIARAFKLSTNSIEPLSFLVPRKAEGFQSDIYPPANSIEPALTAAEWLGGKTARPNLVDLETNASSANKAPISAAPIKTSASSAPSAPASAPASGPASAKPPSSPVKAATPLSRTPPKAATPLPKEEPKSEPKPKEEPKLAPAPTKTPAAREPDVKAKNLEIAQPDSSEDEAPKRTPASATASSFAKSSNGASASASAPVTPPTDELLVQLLSSKATLPTRGSPLAAGYDLYAAVDTVLPARGRDMVSTQIAVAVPAGTYGRIAARSGLAAKHGIDVGAGVVDADYRGEVKVVLFNHNDTEFKISAGDRIAQLVLEKVHAAPVRGVPSLSATSRGAGGFGSTGGFR